MNEFKLIRKETLFILIFLATIFIVAISVTSYALLKRNDTIKNINIEVGSLKYTLASDSLLNNKITVLQGESKTLTIFLTSNNSISSKYELYYNVDNSISVPDGLVVGYLSTTMSDIKVTIDKNETKEISIKIDNNSNQNVTLTFGVDAGLMNNVLVLENGNSLDTELTGLPLFANYIIDLSKSNTNELMIVNQSATSQTSETTEYRYYGATPNNYVTFNNELWRIIGVFDVDDGTGNIEKRVKIIRNESIGSYSYDSSASSVNSGFGVNSWKDSDLMTLLNNGAYFNRTTGTCYNERNNATVACDFTTTGLTESAKEMIDDAKWYTAAANTNDNNWNTITSAQAYTNERGTITKTCSSGTNCNDTVARATSWIGKIGLMYPSDYGYAAESICTSTVLYSYSSTCSTTDWLFNSVNQWVISTRAITSSANASFYVRSSGIIDSRYTFNANGVRPVTYLTSDIAMASGTGTSSDPFTLTK